MNDQIIYAFQKSATEEVRLTLREFKGKHYLDLRVFFCLQGATEFRPTRKGLTFAASLAPELEKAFEALSAKATGLTQISSL